MNIYVGNLSYKAQEDEIKKEFEQFGEVTSVRIIQDRETGRSKGFAFVEMPEKDAADAAIESLNGKELQGRALKVNAARPKKY